MFEGPSGGTVNRILFDPHHRSTMYASTTEEYEAGYLFRSFNRGLSWRRLAVKGWARIHPVTGKLLVWNYSELYLSTDQGREWVTVHLPDDLRERHVLDMAFHSQNDSYLFAVVGNISPSIYVSRDSGSSWMLTQTFSLNFVYDVDLRISPSDGKVAYLTTAGNGPGRLWRSTNAGRTWTLAVSAPKTGGYPARLAVDPFHSKTVYYGFHGRVAKTTDGGNSWSVRRSGCNPDQLSTSAANSREIFAQDTATLCRSTDAGGTWHRIVDRRADRLPGVLVNRFTAVGIDPFAEFLFLGVFPQGLFRSLDKGTSWHFSNKGLQNIPIVNVEGSLHSPGSTFGVTNRSSGLLYRSTDQGRSWALSTSIRKTRSDFLNLTTDPANPDVLAFHHMDRFWVSTNAGKDWMNRITPRIENSVLAFSPSDPNTIFLGGWNPGPTNGSRGMGVFVSSNLGTGWTQMNRGLTDQFVLALAIDPANATRLFAATRSGVFRSLDAGENWTLYRTGLPTDIQTAALSLSPLSAAQVYGCFGGSVYASADGGRTWQQKLAGSAQDSCRAVAADPAKPSTVYASLDQRVFVSNDGANTWNQLGTRLPGFVADIAFLPSKIFCATQNGIYSMERP